MMTAARSPTLLMLILVLGRATLALQTDRLTDAMLRNGRNAGILSGICTADGKFCQMSRSGRKATYPCPTRQPYNCKEGYQECVVVASALPATSESVAEDTSWCGLKESPKAFQVLVGNQDRDFLASDWRANIILNHALAEGRLSKADKSKSHNANVMQATEAEIAKAFDLVSVEPISGKSVPLDTLWQLNEEAKEAMKEQPNKAEQWDKIRMRYTDGVKVQEDKEHREAYRASVWKEMEWLAQYKAGRVSSPPPFLGASAKGKAATGKGKGGRATISAPDTDVGLADEPKGMERPQRSLGTSRGPSPDEDVTMADGLSEEDTRKSRTSSEGTPTRTLGRKEWKDGFDVIDSFYQDT